MGFKIKDTGIAMRLENIAKRTNKAATRELERGAIAIRDLARDFAPVDEGFLEESITVDHDRGGINRRNRYSVYVDDSLEVDAKTKVGDYARLVHEGIGKAYGQGPGSLEKAAQLGVEVGPFFMTRALEELEGDIRRRIATALKKTLK